MLLVRSTLNPSWPHYLGCASLLLAVFAGVIRLIFGGLLDYSHCQTLLNKGSWLDSKRQDWQPEGCMLHTYTEREASSCFQTKEIRFIGDSVTRKLFFQVAKLLDVSLPASPKDTTQKHSDHALQTKYGTNISFIWDPFLNTTHTETILTRAKGTSPGDPPAMLVLGSGLWYLRYASDSGGITAWENKMESVCNALSTPNQPADEVVVLPISQVVPLKLSVSRTVTMRPADIDAMNSDLYHRIHPPFEQSSHLLASLYPQPRSSHAVSLPLVFNTMLDDSLTEDGLHYDDTVVKIQALILLNLYCNNLMPKVFPMNKTCCNSYPMPSLLHALVSVGVIFLGPFLAYRTLRIGSTGLLSTSLAKWMSPPMVISLAIGLMYIADRTGFWLKEQKQFDAWNFVFWCLITLTLGVLTVERGETDLGFLSREQTDEWKGWMQVVILIYHYFGASKISGIYNPIRTLVASYIFMTGYGHTMFYLRKADYGFLRMAQILVRLNLFTILLAYTMNTDYISYYFTPLVSMWYLVVYATLLVAARFNDHVVFVIVKILLSSIFTTWFMGPSWLLEACFDILHRFFNIHWSSREWAFRVNLDIWIVYLGMLAAVACTKMREYKVSEYARWPLIVNNAVILSSLVFIWYFVFELNQESKFTYNTWHPYISALPVLAYAIIRNANSVLRSRHSKVFAAIGKCSLETFVIQYHLWLAADTKGILLVLPWTSWRPLNFMITTVMFLYVSDRVSQATTDLTAMLCGTRRGQLPAPVTEPFFNVSQEEPDEANGQEVQIPMSTINGSNRSKGVRDEGRLVEPNTPIRPNIDVQNLRFGTHLATFSSFWGLGTQVVICLIFLWLLNIFWVYT